MTKEIDVLVNETKLLNKKITSNSRYVNEYEGQSVVVTATKLNALLSQFDSAGPHPSIALLHTCINLVTLIEKDETDDKKCAKLFTEYQDAMKQALTLLQPLYAQRIKK